MNNPEYKAMTIELKPGHVTPWGPAQTVETIGPGIAFVTTASHGGIYLSPERFAAMPEKYRKTFAGGPWYEEDCDWFKVAITFPEYFSEENVAQARRSIEFWDREAQS